VEYAFNELNADLLCAQECQPLDRLEPVEILSGKSLSALWEPKTYKRTGRDGSAIFTTLGPIRNLKLRTLDGWLVSGVVDLPVATNTAVISWHTPTDRKVHEAPNCTAWARAHFSDIHAQVAEHENVLIAGDLNASRHYLRSGEHRHLDETFLDEMSEKWGYVEAHRQFHRAEQASVFRPGPPAGKVYQNDHVFLRGSLSSRLVGCDVVDVDRSLSDHNPIVAVFAID
jgi:endonuclease/exonuclease/phosphatase family metal-dependent hydrolase